MSNDSSQAQEPAENKPKVTYEPYTREDQLAVIQDLVSQDLSEPYTIFTFRFFVHEFPELCIFAYVDEKPIGVIVCRQDPRVNGVNRGYIGMLAVKKPFRHMGIATQLAEQAISKMRDQGAQEIVLETEVDNHAALAFYSRLNFMRYKRLHAFYLNRKDAFRLLLPLPSPSQEAASTDDAAVPLDASVLSTPFASSHATSPAESAYDSTLYS